MWSRMPFSVTRYFPPPGTGMSECPQQSQQEDQENQEHDQAEDAAADDHGDLLGADYERPDEAEAESGDQGADDCLVERHDPEDHQHGEDEDQQSDAARDVHRCSLPENAETPRH